MIKVTVNLPGKLVDSYRIIAVYKGVGMGKYLMHVVGKYGPEPDDDLLERFEKLSEDDEIYSLNKIVPSVRERRPPYEYRTIQMIADGTGETVRGAASLATMVKENEITYSRAATTILVRALSSEWTEFEHAVPEMVR